MNNADAPEVLTVLYDGACPMCRREIAHAKGLAERRSDSALCFVDISPGADATDAFEADRATLMARFHVQRSDGSRLDGAAAFVAMWSRLPGWRWLARLARLPGVLTLLELTYKGFLRVRPAMQALVRRWEDASQGPRHDSLGDAWAAELRSDHAGETGAVQIYRGISVVARWRGDTELLAFAQRHGDTEAEHLRLIETWLPIDRHSRLLGPWRWAGWLTGALPALAGRRAVYATIAAIETFVDRHYQLQIERLRAHGGPVAPVGADDLLTLLTRCQADEREHRDEAAALANTDAGVATKLPWPLRAWCALIGGGSAAAVALARRL